MDVGEKKSAVGTLAGAGTSAAAAAEAAQASAIAARHRRAVFESIICGLLAVSLEAGQCIEPGSARRAPGGFARNSSRRGRSAGAWAFAQR
jgi:hypothetical protein